ncbi:cobyrinate a,c-diamide synthase [Parabacteroides bouchesdurhonensis]|uniref:cobyrinate a,c-diamide synthase n=1 Tax=Parabacteroides bouchesdurhonensis TaxID=1936995 RepID=UPI000C830CA7|nr:cobyrinate a,c-diamide synthase [Parabacteroides bouchesdurhonensis]
MKSHLLIGATSSGSGKTTFTLGLLRALKNRSLQVQPYKCGPDYIDTQHHKMAAGCPSVNLDGFMMSDGHIKELYTRYSFHADVAVTEGVMGLFDGSDRMKGSSAEIAHLLDIPVILIVNAKSTAYSAAAILYGFKHFYKGVRIVGVIFNMVASEGHYEYLKHACEDAGVEALGYLPKQSDVEIPSRHLGLTLDDNFCFETFADRIANLVEDFVDIDRLLEITACSIPSEITQAKDTSCTNKNFRIAIAKDAAFNFMYEENLRFLHRMGTVTYFSPLKETAIPKADFVYLPGGYPELYLGQLSDNRSMLESVKQYVEAGGKLLAECGGMMYLGNEITGTDGKPYPMAGILNQSATMENMKLTLGYRTLIYDNYELKGHEFHYSRILPQKNPIPSIAKAYTAKGRKIDTPLYSYKNMLAGYTHLYWGDPSLNNWFINFLKNKL